ncbi:hypothetical protein ACFX1Z_037426 [Malus domestica]
MIADCTARGNHRWDSLSLGMFWVQFHNVPPLCMTEGVALAIGGCMGTVMRVDKSSSRDCIGRFLRVKMRFNVREPLMRGTFVNFLDDGRVRVEFKYECLPRYCLICGLLGHAMRVCGDKHIGVNEGGNHGRRDEFYAFKNLDAVIDLKGKPMDVAT